MFSPNPLSKFADFDLTQCFNHEPAVQRLREPIKVMHIESLKDNNTKVSLKPFQRLAGDTKLVPLGSPGAEPLVGGLEGARVSCGHLGRKAKAP